MSDATPSQSNSSFDPDALRILSTALGRPEHPTNILNKYAGNRLLAALPDQAIALLEPDLRQVTLREGMVCYGAGGMISLLVTTSHHNMFATNSVGRYGAVGLQCGNGPRLSFTRQ